MSPTSSALRKWLREGCFVAIGLGFAVATVWRARTLPQVGDAEAAQTIVEATSISAGFHRWGMLEYTHHPIGRAYLLIPLVRWDLGGYLEIVPDVVAAIAGGLALWALLRRATTWPLRLGVIALFAALLLQPGYARWLGNLHQHSYNMSSILFLVFLCAQIERGIWLALTAFAWGWIGYDFFFAQVVTVLTLRLAFWNQRRDAAPLRQLFAAGGDTAAFLTGFFCATLLHYVQNVLYFSSAALAYADLYGSMAFRTGVASSDARLQQAFELTSVYIDAFLGDPEWSDPVSLAAATALLLAGIAHAGFRRLRAGVSLWKVVVALLVLAGAPGTVFVWFLAAPRHAAPHLHLFPRMLLVPFIVGAAGAVLVLAPDRPGGTPSVWRSLRWLAAMAVAVTVNWFGPSLTAAPIDARFYDNAWISTNGAVDTTRMAAPLLPATPTASSIGEYAALDGPLKLKKNLWIIGGINIWGTALDTEPGLRWSPVDMAPSWYEQRFAGPANVTDVTLRVWGVAREQGAHTPAEFTLTALALDGTPRVVERYPDPANPPMLLGKYLAFHYHFAPAVVASGLRLDFGKTVGGKPPVLIDFQAFGTPVDGSSSNARAEAGAGAEAGETDHIDSIPSPSPSPSLSP